MTYIEVQVYTAKCTANGEEVVVKGNAFPLIYSSMNAIKQAMSFELFVVFSQLCMVANFDKNRQY